MSLTLDENNATYQIRSYRPGFLQVNELTFHHSIVITADTLIDHWPPQSLNELQIDHLTIALEKRPGILLIGTGSTLTFPPIALYGHAINQGISVEIMNTHAACRTYNILVSEGRSVMAALIIR